MTRFTCVAMRLLGCLVVAGFLFLGFGAPALAQDESRWSEPVNLSNTDRPSVLADVAADSEGNVYAVWCEGLTDEDRPCELINFTMWDGQAWSQPVDIRAQGGWLPRIAVDSTGRLYLVWHGSNYIWAWAQDNPADARSWSKPVNLWNTKMGDTYWTGLIVDSSDSIHVIWRGRDLSEPESSVNVSPQETHCLSGCYGVWYTRSADHGQTWMEPVQIVPEGSIELPVLTVDGRGNPYVVWNYRDRAGLGLNYSLDGGVTWDSGYWVTQNSEVSELGVAVNAAGTIVVVWKPGFFTSTSDDGGRSWSEPQALRFATGETRYGGGQLELVVDSADVIHLFGSSHWTWEGGGWQVEPMPDQDPCSVGAYNPKVDVSQGNVIHLVTHERLECQLGKAGALGRGDVFYMRYDANASHESATSLPPMPTVTPAPTSVYVTRATAAPTAQTTPNPTAPLNINPAQLAAAPMDPLVIGIGLPLVLMAVVVLVYRILGSRRSR